MSFFNELGELGSSAVGTIGDLVDAYGDNATNRSDADAVRIRNASSQILINEQRAAAEIAAKRNQTQLLNTVAYVALALIAVLVASSVYKNATG